MTNSTLTTLAAAQIISANLGPRYKGRTALVRAAEQGNAQALELLSATPSQRRIAAVTGKISHKLATALGLADELERVAQLRRIRHAAQLIHDPILNRRINNVPRRATLIAFRAALVIADFRETKHGATRTIEFVMRGDESATNSIKQAWPSEVGLPANYTLGKVSTSHHTYCVSTAIFDVPRSDRARRGKLNLSSAITVLQSRGASIRTEVKR